MSSVLIAAAVYLALSAFAGAYVATQKAREPLEGLLFGVVFGPIGVLIEANLPRLQPSRVVSTARTTDERLPQRATLDAAQTEPERQPQCGYPTPRGECIAPATHGLYVNGSRHPSVERCDAHIDAERDGLLQSHPDWRVSRPAALDA